MVLNLQASLSLVARHTVPLYISASHLLLTLAFAAILAYYLGWIHRFIWYMAEREVSKILNHTPVTVGGFRMDIFRGRYWFDNVIVHAPRRSEWKWESPVIGRIGQAYVECNVARIILSIMFLRYEPPIDIDTVHLQDVQGFVERKQQVLNFFLLDPHNILPDPQDLYYDDSPTSVGSKDKERDSSNGSILSNNMSNGTNTAASYGNNHHHHHHHHHVSNNGNNSANTNANSSLNKYETPPDTVHSPDKSETISQLATCHSSPMDDAIEDTRVDTMGKAQQVVQDMVKAIQSLGKAAQQKGSWQDALAEHKDQLTSQLKAFQSTDNKAPVLKEGVKLVQEVSKNLVERTQEVHKVVMPERRKLPTDKVVYARLGRFMMQDCYIFTRGSLDGSWQDPIYLPWVSLKPAEFSPPLSAIDEQGWPLLYQPIDRTIDLLIKRLVAEMAKANTGRLFHTAMGVSSHVSILLMSMLRVLLWRESVFVLVFAP
jgi:hypothetical protein